MPQKSLITALLMAFPLFLHAQKKWELLENGPFNGSKQDDVYFTSVDTGWAVNGSGEIWKTTDGGGHWQRQTHMPGTYFRCIGFLDSLNGFAGNLAPGFFENVTDTHPLYRTRDGGKSWEMVMNISGTMPVGLCAINVVNDSTLYAGGRVSGPAYLLKSTDRGESWESRDLSDYCKMIMDVHFFHPDTGFVFAATHDSIEVASALILKTVDGGTHWDIVFTSERVHEICWKVSFPTRQTGYTSILSYSKTHPYRHIIKTTDGGNTWQEMPLDDNACVAFGIGFIDEEHGWVGTDLGGYYTKNGGKKWKRTKLGKYTNKFRFVRDGEQVVGYAIGERVFRLRKRRCLF